MTIETINLFFDYEEAIQLYVETRNPALRLRAITLRRQFLDALLGDEWWGDPSFIANGQAQVPRWLAEEN